MKHAYELDEQGFIIERYLVDDKEEPEGMITVQLPQPLPFHKPRWDGEKWEEGATQEEIDEITRVEPTPPTDTELLGQSMTERELEAIQQGQQITDMDIRLLMLEMGANSL